MAVEQLMSGGPILLGIMIALTEAMKWPRKVHFAWAGVSLIWGVLGYVL